MEITVLAKGLKFPEGPVITPDGNIYFVELVGGTITNYNRDSKLLTRFETDGAPNGMMVQDSNTLVFCDSKQNSIRKLNLETKQLTTLANSVDNEPLRAPNDLIQDSDGNILFTCPGGSQNKPIGYMCVLTPDGNVSKIADNMYFPNGLLLINNEKNIIINETWKHRLVIGDWNKKELKIENIKDFNTIGGTAEPDGLTLHRDNKIYAAVYGTGKIWIFDTTGTLLNQISLPGNNPTNLCFDDIGDLGLLVTEAEKGQLLSIKE